MKFFKFRRTNSGKGPVSVCLVCHGSGIIIMSDGPGGTNVVTIRCTGCNGTGQQARSGSGAPGSPLR